MPDVGVIFGGPSPEHDVSVLTGLQASRELSRSSDHSVRAIYWTKTGDWFEVDPGLEGRDFIQGPPKSADALQFVVGPGGGFSTVGRRGRSQGLNIEAVLVCCHGGPGEDGSLQAALDLAHIPHAGPSVAGAALGMDKLAFGSVVSNAGLPTLPRVLLEDVTEELDFPGPYIVKPRFGGSSIGIEVVEDLGTARALLNASVHLSRGAVLEPYRADLWDLQIAVRTYPELQVSAIERPMRELTPNSRSEILSYRDKYSGGEGMVSAPRQVPADIADTVAAQIDAFARRLAVLCRVRGIARVDFLSDGVGLWVNELNTIPGSLAKYLWIHPNIPFPKLLNDLIEESMAIQPLEMSTAGADGTILDTSGSIASKLA